MSNNITFKAMRKRGCEDPQRLHREKENKEGPQVDLYRMVTNQIQSQQFQKGDLMQADSKREASHRKNSAIFEVSCDDEIAEDPPMKRTSLINSKINSNNFNSSLLESKLYETKGELFEQISDLQAKFKYMLETQQEFLQQIIETDIKKKIRDSKTYYQHGLSEIVNQLNNVIEPLKSKSKQALSLIGNNKTQIVDLQKKFNSFVEDIEEKLERIMNESSSVHKSMGAGVSYASHPGDYVLDLRNSLREANPQNHQISMQQMKVQVEELQEAVKKISIDFTGINCKIENSVIKQKDSDDRKMVSNACTNVCVENQKQMDNSLKKLERGLEALSVGSDGKYEKLYQVLQVQEDNIKGMNEEFSKVVNTQILPKIRKIEQAVPDPDKITEKVAKEVMASLKPLNILKVRASTDTEREKIGALSMPDKTPTYLVDEDLFLMDSFGVYLLDENSKRMKLDEDQIYYLQTVEGLQIVEAKAS